MKNLLIVFSLFFSMLHAEEVELNLPERFDAKVSKWWITENGVEITNKFINKITSTPMVFHFNKNSFSFTSKKKLYLSVEQHRYYSSISGKGKFIKGKLTGKMISKNWNYSKDTLHFYDKYTSNLTSTVQSDGKIYIVDTQTIKNECKTREQTDKGWGPFKACSGEFLSSVHKIETDFQTHFLLQLPINQTQSSQTFIPDTPSESEPMQERPITIPKTNLSANIGASAEATEEEPKIIEAYDPCKDPNRDEAVEKYCKNKAYNKKLDEEEDARKKAEYEAKEKAEKEYQAKLAKYNEEERQINLKVIQENEKDKKRREEIEKQQNKAFHDSIAKEMQERKDKQAEIKKAHYIVDRFGDGDYESQRLSHNKIEELSKNADFDKSQKIKDAMRKQYYDSKQIKLQGEAEYQIAKAKEIDKKAKYLNTVKDTALTVNKVIAKFDPTGTGDKIVSAMENTYAAIEGHEKGGWSGAVDNLVEKKASDLSGGWSDTAKEEIETYKKYQQGSSITLKKSDYYYDKKGNRFNKVKKGQKLYDINHNEITFSFTKRIFKNTVKKLNDDHNAIHTVATKVEEIKEGVVTGDFNKAVNAGLDVMDAKDSIDGGTDKVVKKLEGL